MLMNFKIISAAAALLAASCAQLPQAVESSWQLAQTVEPFATDGRLAVKVEGKGSYANFDWSYQPPVEIISINTPLGSTLGQLCRDADGASAADADGNRYYAATAEELSRQLLGFELPVQHLHIWLGGKRVADTPYQVLSDGSLQQFGWKISRRTDNEGQTKILQMENDRLNVRLAFGEISTPADGGKPQQCADAMQ